MAPGARGAGRSRTASEDLPVWSASVSMRCWVTVRGVAPVGVMRAADSQWRVEEICRATRERGWVVMLRRVTRARMVRWPVAGAMRASRS